MSSVYMINKGVNRPIVFRGLKAQYIWWLAIGLSGLLVLFTLLYIAGVSVVICMGFVLCAGLFLFRYVYHMNKRYGEHGMMKRLAQQATPKWIYCDQLFKE
jgi:hypothetical protein